MHPPFLCRHHLLLPPLSPSLPPPPHTLTAGGSTNPPGFRRGSQLLAHPPPPSPQAAPGILQSFAGAANCSRTQRAAVELLHISKSGGTSMCQLAKEAGLRNPAADMDGNCLVGGRGQD